MRNILALGVVRSADSQGNRIRMLALRGRNENRNSRDKRMKGYSSELPLIEAQLGAQDSVLNKSEKQEILHPFYPFHPCL